MGNEQGNQEPWKREVIKKREFTGLCLNVDDSIQPINVNNTKVLSGSVDAASQWLAFASTATNTTEFTDNLTVQRRYSISALVKRAIMSLTVCYSSSKLRVFQ